MEFCDLLVIGGGINGTGVARDAAGRGLRVVLCEKDDLAGHTSSASTKLIHGGLRYLETGEFGLVRKSLREREVLLYMAPHIIWPLEFILPHHAGLRPAWLLRLGLWLYDRLGGRSSLPASRRVRLRDRQHAAILQDRYRRGFSYFDCWVEDARLVVLNALDAAERGARILPRTRFVGARRGADRWTVELQHRDGQHETIAARAVVNAAGPWVDAVDGGLLGKPSRPPVRLVRGSHVVVPRLYRGEHAYLFQTKDGRVVFAIPFEGEFTLLGTTEAVITDPDAPTVASGDEERYLLEIAGQYFNAPIAREAVRWRYSGVRALLGAGGDSVSRISRDYMLAVDEKAAPVISVLGGKITTYRRLAEDVMAALKTCLPETGSAWTRGAPLPGGDFEPVRRQQCIDELAARFPFLQRRVVERLFTAYGTRTGRVLGEAAGIEDLGGHLGAGLYEAELRYLVECEFATTAEDVLWRRSRLGLHMSADGRRRVEDWMRCSKHSPQQHGEAAQPGTGRVD